VDYWNYIGWTDPFSRPEWSQRQQRYAAAMRSSQVYTPQMVVNGSSQVVGSNESAVRREIAAATRGAAAVRITVSPQGGQVSVTATADRIPAGQFDVMVAIYEETTETAVPRGENAGRTLRNDFVVRSLVKAVSFRGNHGASVRAVMPVKIDPKWNRARLGVVAFAQDQKSLRIVGAARTKL
jgi:hypothetical protein